MDGLLFIVLIYVWFGAIC